MLGRSSTLHCLPSRDCETPSLPRERQNGARRAVGAVIGNLDSPSPSRKRIPRLGTDLQNRASFHGNVKIARAHAPPTLHPPRSAHASWPCWPRTASRAPSCAFASSVCLQSPPGWFVQGCRLFFFFQKLKAWAAQTPEFMIHGYITTGCHARGTRILGLPLFTILAHLTCFLPVFPSGPVSCLISTSRRASIRPRPHQRPRPRTPTDRNPALNT